ncbi:MAG: alpha/beta fold hydrolase [Actinomycetota bacterium]|nr:alpha/beta fold hydrolase [Actinomycetota bacterium]
MPLHADLHGEPGEPRVVLVHGFTQTRRSWDRLLLGLVEHHQVVAVDAPGHGRSAGHHNADLVEGADLVGDIGGEADYIGYSMGGRLVLHLALKRPDLVRRVVLVGATAGLDTEAERRDRRDADEALAADLERDGVDTFLARWLANPLFATLPDEAANIEDRRENTVEGLAASLRNTGTGTQAPLWGRVAEAMMPALFVVGERDEKFTALAHRLSSHWGGDARVAVVPDAGHACHLEQPDAFLDVVLPFLDDDGGQRTASAAARSNP